MMWMPAELDTYLEQVADLSHAEYGVLRCLSLSEDREIHMSRLAATASVTPSHLSRIVGRLEKRDLLARSTDATLSTVFAKEIADSVTNDGILVFSLCCIRLSRSPLMRAHRTYQ